MTSRSGRLTRQAVGAKQAVVAGGGAKWPELKGRTALPPQNLPLVVAIAIPARARVRPNVRSIEVRAGRPFHRHPARVHRTVSANFHVRSGVLRDVLSEVLDRRVYDLGRENPGRTLGVRRTGERRAKETAKNLSVLEAERARQVLGAGDRTIDRCVAHGRTVAQRTNERKCGCPCQSYARSIVRSHYCCVRERCDASIIEHVNEYVIELPPLPPPQRGICVGRPNV